MRDDDETEMRDALQNSNDQSNESQKAKISAGPSSKNEQNMTKQELSDSTKKWKKEQQKQKSA